MHTIPLYDHAGHILRTIAVSALADLPVHVVRNRSGIPVRAYLLGQPPLRPVSQGRAGEAFEQHLSCGSVWALRMAPRVAA